MHDSPPFLLDLFLDSTDGSIHAYIFCLFASQNLYPSHDIFEKSGNSIREGYIRIPLEKSANHFVSADSVFLVIIKAHRTVTFPVSIHALAWFKVVKLKSAALLI